MYTTKIHEKMLAKTDYCGVGKLIWQNDDLPTAQAAGDTIN